MESYAQLCLPQDIFYGRGSLSAVGKQAARYGSKALIISDQVMEELGIITSCADYLAQAGVASAVYQGVNSEPTDRYVEQALTLFRKQKCDVIVALGGGSCLDTAKAVGVLALNDGCIGDYYGENRKEIKYGSVPQIAVPTTAGTGSEATDVTVINNTSSGVKMMIKHPAFMPKVAIVDPVLTKSLPPHVVAATGIDALSHAIEAYISRLAHPFTNMLALSAIQLIWQNIIRAFRDEADIDAKENMSIASMQAGMAFANSSVCLVHGMSRPIGAYFNVPHGVSNAMLLPGVLEFTKDYALYRLAALGRMLKPELKAASNETVAETFIYDLKQLCNDLAIPNMKTWGIEQQAFENMLDTMATDAIASGSPNNNLRVATHKEIVALYRHCYNYSF